MTTPVGGSGGGYLSATASIDTANTSNFEGGFASHAMTFLGMSFTAEESKKLWQSIMAMISHQIQHDNERAIAALRKLREEQK